MKRVVRLGAALCSGGLVSVAAFATVRDPTGCYLATPAVYVPGVYVSGNDTSRAVVALEAGGRMRWPQLPRRSRDSSAWTVRGDSLFAWSTSGFGGWRYQLKANTDGWEGVATFHSAFMTDQVTEMDLPMPGSHPARWIRRACS